MVEFDLVIGHVGTANLADMVVAANHLQHDGSGNVTAFRSGLSGFCSAALSEEHWARVAEDLALNIVWLVGCKGFKQVRTCVVEAADLIPDFVLGLCLAIGDGL
jgi:hypothetical protein